MTIDKRHGWYIITDSRGHDWICQTWDEFVYTYYTLKEI